uniref:Odorant receptor n=1 Tax=Aphidius gifuensis TaxID=684658 RepID=A0A3S9LWC8_APHGI|nr:odorant receptor [Aphidius gifuensis]
MSLLSYSIIMLRVLGLWYPDDDNISKWKKRIYMIYTFLLFLIMYTFTLSQIIALSSCMNDANEFTNATFMSLTMLAACVKMWNMITHRKTIYNMIKILENNTFKIRDDHELKIQNEQHRRIKIFTIVYGLLIESTVSSFTRASIIRDIPERDLPFKALLPYSLSSSFAYWFSYIHQTIAHYYGASINAAIDAHFASSLIATCGQIKILKYRFQSMHQIIEKIKILNNESREKLKKKLLIGCEIHHLAIYQFAKTTNNTFKIPIFIQYFASALVLCVSTFSLSQIEPLSTEFISLFMYLICVSTQIYIYCDCATDVYFESDSISTSIYKSNWTSLSVSNQKSLIIIMARTLKPIKYTSGYIELSLTSFNNLLKMSYSIYNVLKKPG